MRFGRKINPDSKVNTNFITKKRLREDEINFDELRSYRLDRVKKELEKNNLDTVLLLNPKNEEATYRLAELYIVQSDFLKSKNLIKKLKKICNKFCTSINKLEEKLVAASKK